MSITANLTDFKKSLANILDIKTESARDGLSPDDLISSFSDSFSTAVDDYLTSAVVTTDSIIPTGQIDSVTAGTNAAPLLAKGSGSVSDLDINALKTDIEKIYKESTDMSSATGVNKKSPKYTTEEIVSNISSGISEAILKYVKTATVTTEISYPAFVTLGILPGVTPASMMAGEMADGTGQGGEDLGLTGLDSNLLGFKNAINAAYKDSTVNGAISREGYSYKDVNGQLGSDMGKAIYDFFILSVVKTEDTSRGGTTALAAPPSGGSQIIAPPAAPIPTVPIPMTLPGAAGNAEGTIS